MKTPKKEELNVSTFDISAASQPEQPTAVPQVPESPAPKKRQAEFPESRLFISVWADPVLDNLGHDPRSAYVEQFWLSILGPSCLLLLRRFAVGLERSPDGYEVTTSELAAELGLGTKGGKHGPFWRSLERACRFGAAQRNGSILAVHRRLPPLTTRQTERLAPHLQVAHQQWLSERLNQPTRQTIATWSPARASEPELPEAA